MRAKQLIICHELPEGELKQTVCFAKENIYPGALIDYVHCDELDAFLNGLELRQADLDFLTLHLDLKREIDTHKKISASIDAKGIKQLNPYSKLAEVSDDKWTFYNLMLANDIKQAKTELVTKSQVLVGVDRLLEVFSNLEKLVLKPRYGTERIDFKVLDFGDKEAMTEHINKILLYDDVLVQEYIAAEDSQKSNEYKVIFFEGKMFSELKLEDSLSHFVKELVELLEANVNHKIRLLSLDILEPSPKEYIVLEANIRPAGLHRSSLLS